MSSPDAQWWQIHAGEYVLGTLDAKERGLFERILRHDPDLQRIVGDWETHLVPLLARVPEREPPPRVWEEIERRVIGEPVVTAPDEGIRGTDIGTGDARPDPSPDRSFVAPASTVPFDRTRRRRGGRAATAIAALATAASLLMGALLHQQNRRLDALEGSVLQADGVSVILGENGAPLWLVQADFSGERVQVTALAPPAAGSGGDFQLWQVLPDGGGVAAVSLLPETGGTSQVTAVPGLARRFDAFAVSLEPDGGSPEPVPTGAVLYQGGVTYSEEEAAR